MLQIPIPSFATGGDRFGYHLKLNEPGDVLIAYDDSAGDIKGFIFNPGIDNDPTDDEFIELLDADGTPLRMDGERDLYFHRV